MSTFGGDSGKDADTGMIEDIYGRKWGLPEEELCEICKQPDNCGNCNHTKLTKKDVECPGGYL